MFKKEDFKQLKPQQKDFLTVGAKTKKCLSKKGRKELEKLVLKKEKYMALKEGFSFFKEVLDFAFKIAVIIMAVIYIVTNGLGFLECLKLFFGAL